MEVVGPSVGSDCRGPLEAWIRPELRGVLLPLMLHYYSAQMACVALNQDRIFNLYTTSQYRESKESFPCEIVTALMTVGHLCRGARILCCSASLSIVARYDPECNFAIHCYAIDVYALESLQQDLPVLLSTACKSNH